MYGGECIPCFSPILGPKGDVAFSTQGANGIAPGTYQGTPDALHLVNGVSSRAYIQSLNKSHVLAGIDAVTVNGQTATVAFAASGGTVRHVFPRGTANVVSAVINDHDVIAGSLQDKSGVWHGFLQARGSVTLFEMPAAATYIGVTGINNLGRVVGVYTDTNNVSRPFLYNGTAVSNIANLTLNDAYEDLLAINDHGVIILSAYSSYQSLSSFRILCGGSGC
jgi:probable HAF family extracellular repeat protein